MDQFARTQLLLGAEGMERLRAARVAVFGVGGVGGYAVEALVRSGVGAVDLFDDDRVCLTNLNRQLVATRKTIGEHKVDALAERMREINPDVQIGAHRMFYMPDVADEVDLSIYDYVIDAIDTVTAKLELAVRCDRLGVPLISAMGAGNKLDPTRFRVADVFETTIDPLARVMRRELKKRGVKRLKVVYSTEVPMKPLDDEEIGCRGAAYESSIQPSEVRPEGELARPEGSGNLTHCVCPPGTTRKCSVRRDIPGSTAFVPPVVGMIIAGEIVRALSGVSGT